jgi:hypothetical protein
MAVLTSGVQFLSGIALYLGAPLSIRSVLQAHTAASRRRRARSRGRKTPLDDHQKRALLDSIRNDDWHE